MKKKTIIIVLIVIALLVAGAIALKTYLEKQKSLDPSMTTPALDGTPTFPASESRDGSVKVEDANAATEIKNALEKFVNEPITAKARASGVGTIRLSDTKGDLLSLSLISQSTGLVVPDSLATLISDRDYEIFYCPSKNNNKDYGLVLYAKPNVNRPLDNSDYQKITDQLSQWESSMLRDLHSILFPDGRFSDTELSYPLKFQDGEARFALVILPGGKTKSINYKQFGSPVVISSSLECLRNAEGYYFDTEE